MDQQEKLRQIAKITAQIGGLPKGNRTAQSAAGEAAQPKRKVFCCNQKTK